MCSGRLERPTSSTSGWPLCLIGVRAPGASDWPRTSCLPFTRRMLCRVSYRGVATPPTRVRQGAPGRESPGLSRQPPKTRTIFHLPVAISGRAPHGSATRAGRLLPSVDSNHDSQDQNLAACRLADRGMVGEMGVEPTFRPGLSRPALPIGLTRPWCAARATIPHRLD